MCLASRGADLAFRAWDNPAMGHSELDRHEVDRWTGPLVALALTLCFLAVLVLIVVIGLILFPDFHGMKPHMD